MDYMAGKFVVLDGPDGSGKSTQFEKLSRFLSSHDLEVCEVREPGGTKIGELLRDILLDRAHENMDLRCEMLLYMASRAQLVRERIRPALKRNAVVLADRFVSSTIAYQGYAGGMSLNQIDAVTRVAIGHTKPDLYLILDVDEDTASQRMHGKVKPRKYDQCALAQSSLFADRMELLGLEFQRKVRDGYRNQALEQPDTYNIIDASGNELNVFKFIIESLRRKFGTTLDNSTTLPKLIEELG